MYWYPFSKSEEDNAWEQAEAQADAQAESDESDSTKKSIGNLGEIVIKQYFANYATPDSWTYHNQNAMDNAQPEYEPVDFTIKPDTTIDVKSTTDIRKFDPVSMYYTPDERAPGHPKENYPKVDTDTADVFIFVQISHQRNIRPGSRVYSMDDLGENQDELLNFQLKTTEERSGNSVGVILGWISADDFYDEMVANMNDGAKGKFTKFALNDLHDLLQQTDTLEE